MLNLRGAVLGLFEGSAGGVGWDVELERPSKGRRVGGGRKHSSASQEKLSGQAQRTAAQQDPRRLRAVDAAHWGTGPGLQGGAGQGELPDCSWLLYWQARVGAGQAQPDQNEASGRCSWEPGQGCLTQRRPISCPTWAGH